MRKPRGSLRVALAASQCCTQCVYLCALTSQVRKRRRQDPHYQGHARLREEGGLGLALIFGDAAGGGLTVGACWSSASTLVIAAGGCWSCASTLVLTLAISSCRPDRLSLMACVSDELVSAIFLVTRA